MARSNNTPGKHTRETYVGGRSPRGRRPSVKDSLAGEVVGPGALAGGGSGGSGNLGGTPITRRRLIGGAAAAGAVVVAGGAAAYLHGKKSDAGDVSYLEVPEDAVVTQEDMEAADDYTTRVSLVAEYDLPYGSLVWATSDLFAACLLPTETGSPLAKVGILALGSATLTTVLEAAMGAAEHFEIYDVRASDTGVIWTEADILDGAWRIYTARLTGTELGNPVLVDQGDATYEMPTLAAVGDYAFWQLLPKLPNPDALPSYLMRARMGSSDVEVALENARRMATPPYALKDKLVITPRLDMGTVYYQLQLLDARTLEVEDALTLPSGMKPLEAGYGDTGFSFMFDSIYNYGGGIANLGTYTPRSKPVDGSYSAAPWFRFARTPIAPPCWANGHFIVKSTRPVCGIDLKSGEYFVIDLENGTDNYGEYLATTGVHDTFVTYSNIDHTPVEGDRVYACRVKVWRPL